MADRNRRPTPPERRSGAGTRWTLIALIVVMIAVFVWWLYDGTQNVTDSPMPDLEMPAQDAPAEETVEPVEPETEVAPADPPQ